MVNELRDSPDDALICFLCMDKMKVPPSPAPVPAMPAAASVIGTVAIAAEGPAPPASDNGTTLDGEEPNHQESSSVNCVMTNAQKAEFKRLFYNSLDMRYSKLTITPKFQTQDEYNRNLNILRQWKAGATHTQAESKVYRRFTHVEDASHNSSLRRNNKDFTKVAIKDDVFDIILCYHSQQLGHVVDSRPVYRSLSKEYFGITEEDVKLFISICPVCVVSRGRVKTKQQPLCMIISPTIGKRDHMDLIDMTSSPDPVTGHKWILRLIDHSCGYGRVNSLDRKTAQECSVAVIQILCGMPVFDIIQSDNGGEFLGQTIALINK